MISPLAEGADRIAAQAALDRGAYVDVVLPFAQESYENTFEDDPSRQQFVELLAKARATLSCRASGAPASTRRAAAGLWTTSLTNCAG